MSQGLSFAAAPSTQQLPAHTQIESDPFYPRIDLNQMRQAMRIDNTVTSARLYEMAVAAVIHVNRQLGFVRQAAIRRGQSHLSDTATTQLNGESVAVIRYRHAVYHYTKASLSEQYADFDATGKTASRFEAKQQTADDHRREAHAAIADITSQQRTDCELI